MGTYENSAGLGVRNHYGTKVIKDFGGQVSTSLNTKELSVVWNFDDVLPAASLLDMEQTLPAGSYIQSAKLEVLTAMAGTAGTYTIGLIEPDGSAIDPNGLFLVTEATQAALVADAWLTGDPATDLLVEAGIGVDAQLLVVEGGTVTAGKFRLILEYIQGDVDGTGNYVAGGVRGAGA